MARPFWKTTITHTGCGDAPDGNSHVDVYIETRYRFWVRSDTVIEVESAGPCPGIARSVDFYSTSSRISKFIHRKGSGKGNPLSVIERDKARGGWRWECNGGGNSGWAPTKRDAKSAAKSSCGKGNYSIEKNHDLQLAQNATQNSLKF